MPRFISEQPDSTGTNLALTLTGLAAGESITWLVSPRPDDRVTNNPAPTSVATGANGTFTITNWACPASPTWFYRPSCSKHVFVMISDTFGFNA